MRRAIPRLIMAVLSMALLSTAASATDLPVGFISYDVTGANVAEFDIFNFTGGNASVFPDTTFPITTPLSLSNLSLTVGYADGTTVTFGSSYFTLDSDGLSFDGDQLSTLSGPPTGLFGADSFTLTGLFSTTGVTLNDGSIEPILNSFSATATDLGGLSDGDLAIINAAETPEPASWLLLATGLFVFIGWRAGMLKRFDRRAGSALGIGLLIITLGGMKAEAATVKLSAVTSPSSGSAGASTVNVSGTGFPTGSITPANVTVSLATSCGGSGTTTAASAVQNVLGTSDKVSFLLPASLSAGSYFVSISGTSDSNVSFTSSNCATVSVVGGPSPTLSIDTTNPVDWVIKNGALTIDYNSTTGAIWSIVPAGTQDQLVDFSPGNATVNGSVYDPADGESAIGGTSLPANWNGPSGIPNLPATYANKEPKGFYMDLSGFSTVTAVPGYSLTSSYIDWWVAYPASGVSPTNTTEYEEHFVVTPNDPGIHIYFSLNHPAQVTNSSGTLVNNGSGTIGGQVQWIWRGNVNEFTNYYEKLADLSMVNSVITPLPSTDDCFSSDNGRNDQDVTGRDTIDLHPQVGVENAFSPPGDPASQIPVGFHRHFCVKYDFSVYEYVHDAHGLFGNQYGQFVVFKPGHDTLIDGPTKENLALTGNILTIEANSNHYRTGGVGTTSIASGTQGSRIYGPFYVRINHFGMSTDSSIDGGVIQTPDDMFNDAVLAGSNFTHFYDNEATLVSKGYVPSTSRGSVSIQVSGVAGAARTAWAVLSQNAVNQENSTMSHQYAMDISASGTGTFTNVAPGTYRLSVWDFGQWGEYRQDNVVVTSGNTTSVPSFTFAPENFGTVVGTIGTLDRSSHEFLHGAYTQNYPDGPLGYDDREYYGAWNYWADFANTPSPGAPVYYLTDGPGYTATNNPLAWNYAHWGGFNPGLYGGACKASDDTTDAYQAYPGCTSLGDTVGIPAYVATLPGHTGTNGANTPTPPWQIHFATPNNASQAFVVLSLALSSSQGRETVTLNGNSLSYSPPSAFNSDAVERSGLSGYTQWVAFQWPASLLNPAGQDNVITTSVSGVNSNDSDDAIRLELSNGGADPAVTNWHDYYFVTSGKTTASNDTVPNQ